MIHFQRTHVIDANPAEVWSVLGDFMQIDRFAPQIAKVEPLTEGADGMGSKRRNVFENGTSLVEEVTNWREGHGYTVALSDMAAMPLKQARSTVTIHPTGGKAKVSWTFDYRVKFGPLGWVMGQTMMKMMMGKVIDANLKGLEQVVLAEARA